MAKDLKFFMREHKDEIVAAPGPDTIPGEDGEPIGLEIRVLSAQEIRAIDDRYRTRSIAFDTKGAPYVAGGEVVFKTEKDSARAVRHIIAEALVYPNLKDQALMDFYNCVDISEMAQLVFPRPDEYSHVTRAVFAALGLSAGASDDETLEAAKN
jgi:hypothetical protein